MTKLFEKDKQRSLFMYSPTHVFLLKPGFSPFRKGWLDPGFSYTWARDQVLLEGQAFFSSVILSYQEQIFLMETFLKETFPRFTQKEALPLPQRADLAQFRNHLLQWLSPDFSRSLLEEKIEGFLYRAFPLFSKEKARDLGEEILSPFKEAKNRFLRSFLKEEMTYAQFYHSLLQVLSDVSKGKIDPLLTVIQALKKQRIGPPAPLLFADTNWSTFFFAFCVNPGTLELDLWRFDRWGQAGFPMSSWKGLFSKEEKRPWGILTSPPDFKKGLALERSYLKV